MFPCHSDHSVIHLVSLDDVGCTPEMRLEIGTVEHPPQLLKSGETFSAGAVAAAASLRVRVPQ